MQSFAFLAALLFVLGAPALAAVGWRRSRNYSADSVEVVAVAYGGVGIAALSVWLVAQLRGFSSLSVLLASVLGVVILVAPVGARLWGRLREGQGQTPLTGHHDGRMIPDAKRRAGFNLNHHIIRVNAVVMTRGLQNNML